MVYVGCFAFSLGPIVWLLISEIFPLPVRGLGMSLSTLANWVGNFFVSQFFLTMLDAPRNAGDLLDLRVALRRHDRIRARRWCPRRNASCWSSCASVSRA